ncbi:MAG: 30S ribosomal protein S3 [candidate division Zixibacteria bacterium]
MGQKTNPIGFRLGVTKSWNSKWFSAKSVADLIQEDLLIKKYITTRLDNAGLAKVEIIRAPKKVTVDIHTARPGIVIGRRGAEVDKLREELQLLANQNISLNIIEVKKPELSAKLVADSIAKQLEGRVSFRRAMKRSLSATMKMGADGIKIICKGRLNGAEIARSEKYMEGRVPLHTLRADIDYATATAHTTYGCIGVKVWICRGMILDRGDFTPEGREDKMFGDQPEAARGSRRGEKRRKRKPAGRVRRDNLSDKSKKGARRKSRKPRKPGGKPPEKKTTKEHGDN